MGFIKFSSFELLVTLFTYFLIKQKKVKKIIYIITNFFLFLSFLLIKIFEKVYYISLILGISLL